MARHTRFCPFSSMASSPAFADPVLDSTSLLEDFLTSVKSMERFGRAVPRFTERTVSRVAGARSHLVEHVLKQGGNSIEIFWLEFRLEKWIEIPFSFCYKLKLPIF